MKTKYKILAAALACFVAACTFAMSAYASAGDTTIVSQVEALPILENVEQYYEECLTDAEEQIYYLVLFASQLTTICLGLFVIILYQKNQKKNLLIRLQTTLDALQQIRNVEENLHKQNEANQGINPPQTHIELVTGENIKRRIHDELLRLNSSDGIQYVVPDIILNSNAYGIVKQSLKDGKVIAESNGLWNEIETLVHTVSPYFKKELEILSGGKLNFLDYHCALLLKCGFSPSNMSILLGKTKAAITYRRDKLALKIFGEKIGSKRMDEVIRLL